MSALENNQDSARFIVLLDKSGTKSLEFIEKEFQMCVTSSVALNSENRSFNILNDDNSIFFKNLNIVVMQNKDIEQLQFSVKDSKSPIVHFERERIFYPTDEFDLLVQIKSQSKAIQDNIIQLEQILSKKKERVVVPEMDMEWGLREIGINKTQYTGKNIDICILDTGFNSSHPDFSNRSIEGKSFIANETWDKDFHGHGTHCVGVAAGNKRLDTGRRYGVAVESNIKIAKVLSDSGQGTTTSIVDAIDWAIEKKYRIISMSLGSPVALNEPPSLIFEKIGEKALENNCLIIAAAGNDSNRPSMPKPVSSPANCKSIMAIAAVDDQLKVAKFSNGGINAGTGGNINVCAPGVNILSSFSMNAKKPALYSSMSGTSMATPHVSGLAALYMEKFPEKTAMQIWELIEQNAKLIENGLFRDIGKGLIQTLD